MEIRHLIYRAQKRLSLRHRALETEFADTQWCQVRHSAVQFKSEQRPHGTDQMEISRLIFRSPISPQFDLISVGKYCNYHNGQHMVMSAM